jgi:hypothetical protein
VSSLSKLLLADPEPEETQEKRALEDLFEEEPVPLDVFVRDPLFLSNPPLGPIQYEAVKHIERIYLPDLYPVMAREFGGYWAEPVRMTNFVTLQWGKGSGKDHICRVASLRVAYLLLCLRSPQLYFGLPEQDTIHMLNIAASAPQAYQAFFAPITRVVRKGWFADHCEPKMNVISYHKNVEVISGNSDAETQEGLNLILGIADEIDAFKSKEELERFRGKQAREPTKSAEGILKMLRTSASTRFPESFKNVRISYPRFKGSTIQNLTTRAREDNEKRAETSRHYVSGPKLTWEVNPRYDKFERITIPQTDALVPNVASIIEDYEEDPDMAKMMYECRPQLAADPYFKNMDAVRGAVKSEEQPIKIEYRKVTLSSGAEVWEPIYHFDHDFRPIAGANYAMHADLAVTGDRAGIAMSHVVRLEEDIRDVYDEEGALIQKIEVRPVVKTDFVISFSADKRVTPPREIQIRWARQLAFELIKRQFPIKSFTFDGFQSTDSMQILLAQGIESERLSTDLSEDPWRTLRDVIYEGRFSMPWSEICIRELGALGRFANKIDHPIGGSKDEADALACSVVGAILVGGSESEEGEVVFPSETSFLWGATPGASLMEDGLEIDPFVFSSPLMPK